MMISPLMEKHKWIFYRDCGMNSCLLWVKDENWAESAANSSQNHLQGFLCSTKSSGWLFPATETVALCWSWCCCCRRQGIGLQFFLLDFLSILQFFLQSFSFFFHLMLHVSNLFLDKRSVHDSNNTQRLHVFINMFTPRETRRKTRKVRKREEKLEIRN